MMLDRATVTIFGQAEGPREAQDLTVYRRQTRGVRRQETFPGV
jgi:hypothetical protein